MARIIDIVRKKRNEIEADPDKAKDTGDLAVTALLKGINSPAWDAYLAHFDEFNAEQLARLKGQDNTANDEVMDKKRVYVAANGMCGVNSPNTQTLAFQLNSIDEGLDACDP